MTSASAQQPASVSQTLAVSMPRDILLRIVEAEDKRKWNNDLDGLLAHQNSAVRERAALAAGRIGDERAVPVLVLLLQSDKDGDVRAMAAFALGEIESVAGGEALVAEIVKRDQPNIRARAVEALGKIAAALPPTEEARLRSFQKTIYDTLEFELRRRSAPDTAVILLGLTAALRARPEGVGKMIAEFLGNGDPRIRADAANALARLRAKDGNDQLRKLLTDDPDPIVRANAARVLGATQEKSTLEALVDRALKDTDARVRVSAIRALAGLNDPKVMAPLLRRGQELVTNLDTNELLEIVTAVGRLGQNGRTQSAVEWLKQMQDLKAPEVEIALARVDPQSYTIELRRAYWLPDWRESSAKGQAAAEIVNVKTGNPVLDAGIKHDTVQIVTTVLSCPPLEAGRLRTPVRIRPGMVLGAVCVPVPLKAVPDWLRAFAAFKTRESASTITEYLKHQDAIIRATAAELLGELPPAEETTAALISALPVALRDKQLNDAALAILDALAKQKTAGANEAIKSALDSTDHLVRRRAVALLKANGAEAFSARIGTVQTANTRADYQRAILRIGRKVLATVATSKGSFTIWLQPDEAPLTVDSFIRLSRRGYFKDVSFHRVVPNFVIQGGDPRGDGNGGPGYQIRCEINQIPYERGVVGMALSGKDTGGSQWFVTHSPQPHLDGGYTVFGRVISGMDVVDRIARGDVIRSVAISER